LPSQIDATVGGANANSYVDVSAADTFFDNRLNSSAWTNVVDSDDKARALIEATDRIEQEKYRGTRASSTQRLNFPRTGITYDDNTPVPSTVVPRQVCNATMEMALALLVAGKTDILAATGLEQFKSIRAGTVDLSMRDPLQPQQYLDPEATANANQRYNLPPQVQRWLRRWLITDLPAISLLKTGFSSLSRS
jgi:hypothetical protein